MFQKKSGKSFIPCSWGLMQAIKCLDNSVDLVWMSRIFKTWRLFDIMLLSREDSDKDNAKKQKLDDDVEKKKLRDSMDVVPRDDISIDAKQDVMDLHRLVQERYDTTSPEGYDLLLWGDLKILFEPNEEDEIWKNQQDYNLISWRLFDSCGIHMLLMHTGIAIHMMIEKKYPLTQEMLSRMLSRRLEVDHESEMAFELLSNYGVTCKDEAKRRNSKTKTKTFEENCYLLLYAVSSKEDISAPAHHKNMRNNQFPIRRITLHLYAVCTAGHQLKIQS
ncbi:hypothetical protein Tco_0307155 [Tanacetum coccineum]